MTVDLCPQSVRKCREKGPHGERGVLIQRLGIYDVAVEVAHLINKRLDERDQIAERDARSGADRSTPVGV